MYRGVVTVSNMAEFRSLDLDEPPDGIDAYIDALNRQGGSILTTGGLSPRVVADVSRELFGSVGIADGTPLRRRIILQTHTTIPAERYLPDGVETGSPLAKAITVPGADRTSVDLQQSSDTSPFAPDRLSSGFPDELEQTLTAVSAAITELLDPVENPEPGEIRLVSTDIAPLLRRFDVTAVETFIERLTALVRQHRGLAFVFLVTPSRWNWKENIVPHMEGELEVFALKGGETHMKWQFPDETVSGVGSIQPWRAMNE